MLDVILLVLKVLVLILLYLFIWRVARAAGKDLVGGARGAEAGPAVAVTAPDIALPQAPPQPVFSPEERLARREQREAGRTLTGDSLDMMIHIRPRLVVERSPELAEGSEIALEGWLTVGRSPSSSLVLHDPFISSTHARVVRRGQYFYVEDLGSTNGTFVNEKEVTEAQLKLDTRLRIGETVFRYEE